MASSVVGGAFRESVILKSSKSIDPEPHRNNPQSSYTDVPSNGESAGKREKEVDHYGFLYSSSEKDKH